MKKGSNDSIRVILEDAGITPTPVRVLIYNVLAQTTVPLSLSDIESSLETVDKSTISRTLSTFRKQQLLHTISDGSGSLKYELRKSAHDLQDDMHVHFHCVECGSTICLNQVGIPTVKLPEGFLALETSYIITGICKGCANK